MADTELGDLAFFIVAESAVVADALRHYLEKRGARVTIAARADDVRPSVGTATILLLHYSADASLGEKLAHLKRDFPLVRVVVLHEFAERGKLDAAVLSATDHALEKPFPRESLEKAIEQFRFRPLTQKTIYFYHSAGHLWVETLLANLGATVLGKLPDATASVELAIFAPAKIDAAFREALKIFRTTCPETPIFLLYNSAGEGILDSAILAEVAYLVQQDIEQRALRDKLLAFFEQPQHDRRKNPRKKGISQVWISALNVEIGAPELFESPYLIDISHSGLSFQSYLEYRERQTMVVWVVAEEQSEKIIELRGSVRWRHPEGNAYKYGIEFAKEDSAAYAQFARMIAIHAG